ncbi:MAG: class I SAM-dependent methyltransferase [Pseudomonadota bacterium]
MGILSNLKKRIAARRRQRFLTHYRDAVSNIRLRLQDQATAETARYVQTHMAQVQSVTSWRAVHDRAIAAATLEGGLVLEFGVFSGTTARYITDRTGWQMDAFDSFEGLPEAWRDGYDAGTFGRASPPELGPNITLHVGWFEDTVPGFAAARAQDTRPIRYLHVDCDLYSSTKTIFDHLGGRITAGTVIVFDEYFNYAGWQEGEFKAFQDCVAAHGLRYDYLTYNHEHQQVAVKITARGG